MKKPDFDELCINAMRFLAIDAVEKARSGHPGAPMGVSPMAHVLWDRFLRHNPADPRWPNRDRFVLSAGHASAMLYSLLFLTGYDMTIGDLKEFRQWGSRTPGHPEYGRTPGVEATTGPLGQGFGNGVGMAIAGRWLAEHYNRPGFSLFDYRVYAIVSDGDLEEGVSSEAASLAGTLGLGKIVYLYDDNGISIEGSTRLAFTENVAQRFQAYGWQVIGPVDGMDIRSVEDSLKSARAEVSRPSLIICRTTIGYGSPNKAGKASAHGEPLGEEEARLVRRALGWLHDETFYVPPEVLAHFRKALERGKAWQRDWEDTLAAYEKAYPGEARQLQEDLSGRLPEGWDISLTGMFENETMPMATRTASGKIMNAIAGRVHALTGGAADLGPSTRTLLENRAGGAGDRVDHNMHFGVREHAMGAISNGMALNGGLIPYTGTFLLFYDYMRPPVRLAAMMGIRVVFVFTHDSVGLGEDGPTHQPIEQIMGLRAVPNLVTLRPADATETVEAWKIAMERPHGPTALLLTRQDVPVLDRRELASSGGVRQGGYVLWETGGTPDVIIIASGSEVHPALEAGRRLQDNGVKSRVVSLPSWELFDAQPVAYRNRVLPPEIRRRISVEAATGLGWEHYIGMDGVAIGLDRFGASAPGKVNMEKFGFTPEHIVNEAVRLVEGEM
jgi:transketolase